MLRIASDFDDDTISASVTEKWFSTEYQHNMASKGATTGALLLTLSTVLQDLPAKGKDHHNGKVNTAADGIHCGKGLEGVAV